MVMLTFLVQFSLTVLGVILGSYILLAGKRLLWVTLGIIGLTATADLLAVVVASLESWLDLPMGRFWWLSLVAVGVGALGIYIGRTNLNLAALLVGFAAGADLALWFYDIASYAWTAVAQMSAQTAVWVGLPILIIGGLCGLWLIHVAKDEALIIITVVMGAKIIYLALGMNDSSSFTAVIMLSLALIGLVVQYANHQRQIKATTPLRTAEPALPELFPPDFSQL